MGDLKYESGDYVQSKDGTILEVVGAQKADGVERVRHLSRQPDWEGMTDAGVVFEKLTCPVCLRVRYGRGPCLNCGVQLGEQPSSPCARDAACGECAKLKRELENLKRESAAILADRCGTLATSLNERDQLIGRLSADCNKLQREFERLRKRKP